MGLENQQSRLLVGLSAVLSALVLGVVWLDPPPPDDTRGRVWTRALPDLGPESVVSLTVVQGESQCQINKVDGIWRWSSPVSAPAETARIDALVSGLLAIETGNPLETPASAVGLDAPHTMVTLQTVDGQSIPIELGDDSPVGSSTYLRLEGGPVVASRTRVSAVLPDSLADLRSPALIAFNRTDLQSIDILRADATSLRFVRTASEWWLEEPGPRTRADATAIASLVDAARYAEGATFFDTEGPLDRPDVTVRITESSGATFDLALATNGVEWRASGPLQPGQATLAPSPLPDLVARMPAQWFDTHVLPIQPASLRGLTIEVDGEQVAATRSTEGWSDPRVDALLVALETGSALRGGELPAPEGPPTAIIEVQQGETPHRVEVFQAVPLGGRVAREPGADRPMLVTDGTLVALADALRSGA